MNINIEILRFFVVAQYNPRVLILNRAFLGKQEIKHQFNRCSLLIVDLYRPVGRDIKPLIWII